MDLTFISGGLADSRLFSPADSIVDNVNRLVADFDVLSIINCTDLFTLGAANMIDNYWRYHSRMLTAE
jgi:hypothetical protein